MRPLPSTGVKHRVVLKLPDCTDAEIAVDETEHILDVALAAGIDVPYRCLQGWCLTCAAQILEGRIDQSDSRRYFPADRDEGFALPCTGRPESDCVLRTRARDDMRRARDELGLPYPKDDWGSAPEDL